MSTEFDQLVAVQPAPSGRAGQVLTAAERCQLIALITATAREKTGGSGPVRRFAPRPQRTVGLAAAASIAAYVGLLAFMRPNMTDLLVYRGEGAAIRSGASLYGSVYGTSSAAATAHATYPPFAAMLFVPFTCLPVELLRAAVLLGNLALLAATAVLSCRLVRIRAQQRTTAIWVLAAAAPWCEPVFTTLRLGQINLLLLVLVLWDFTRPSSSRSRGVGVGLAAAIKVTPAIFIVYLLLTRRTRAACTAAATFGVSVMASALVTPHATWQFWTGTLFDTSRVGRVENATNQTLRGLMVRMDHSRSGALRDMLLIAAVAVVGLGCAALAHRYLGDRWGLPACAITGLLASPISWSHHWLWCLPVAVLLWSEARRWFPAMIVFWSYAVWAVPHRDAEELHFSPIQTALSAWYVLFGSWFLVLTASRIWCASGRATARTG